MIDTLRVRAKLPLFVWMSLEKKKAYGTYSPGLVKIKDYFNVPPHDGIVTVSTEDFKYVYLEASLPKIAFGHNVKLLYPTEIPVILRRIEDAFIERHGEIEPWTKWEVQRVDPCYAWKLPDNKDAVEIIRFLKTQEYPDKDIHWYPDETITFGGRSFSITFYLKQPEFAKQARRLKGRALVSEAEEGLELSPGVLRYEIRLFKQKLTSIFHEKTIYCKDLLNMDFYYNVLNACLTKTLRNSNRNSISDKNALEMLKAKYQTKGIALRLFCFWKVWYRKELHIKALLKDKHDATTIARNLKDISLAGVGVPESDCSLPFDLSIPSVNAVTPQPAAPSAPAEEQIKKIIGEQEMLDLLFDKEWRG